MSSKCKKTQIFQGFYLSEPPPRHRHVIMMETPTHILQLRKLDLCSKTDISKITCINAWSNWAKVINIFSQLNWFIFGKKITNTLEMSSLLKYRYSNSKQFPTKHVSAIATQKSSYLISLILVNLVANLTVSHSPT